MAMNVPRPSKRERTRRKLLDAGLQVIADRGEALTASDVVAVADVSNGTFYNHFLDRDDFIRALARESLRAITEQSADDTEGTDPAWRFAVASTRVLDAGVRDPLWGARPCDLPTARPRCRRRFNSTCAPTWPRVTGPDGSPTGPTTSPSTWSLAR